MLLREPISITQTESAKLPQLDYDLAIAGGGIVGLTLACALKNSGLRIAIIEAQTQSIAAAKGQAYHITLMSGRIFKGIGVWDEILPHINTFTKIRLSDGDYPLVVEFHPEDLGTPALGYVGEHRVILPALQQFLAACDNVTWLCPVTVEQVTYDDTCATVVLNDGGHHRQIRTRLVVAADGSRSPLREAAGIKTRGWKYWQSCIAAAIRPEHPITDIAHERFQPSGPFAILPIPGGQCRIVWTAPHAEAQAMCDLDDDRFLTELRRRYGDRMGALHLEGGRYLFPVKLMQSDRYVLPRLALVGDAAHSCHPVGGQGLNLGIRDAAALAEVLQSAAPEHIGDLTVLQRYERWRRWENFVILGFTDLLDRMFSNQWLPLVILRRCGLWLLQHVPLVKSLALRLMTGLLGRIPQQAQP